MNHQRLDYSLKSSRFSLHTYNCAASGGKSDVVIADLKDVEEVLDSLACAIGLHDLWILEGNQVWSRCNLCTTQMSKHTLLSLQQPFRFLPIALQCRRLIMSSALQTNARRLPAFDELNRRSIMLVAPNKVDGDRNQDNRKPHQRRPVSRTRRDR
jgi:hypothetical protein